MTANRSKKGPSDRLGFGLDGRLDLDQLLLLTYEALFAQVVRGRFAVHEVAVHAGDVAHALSVVVLLEIAGRVQRGARRTGDRRAFMT